jgi:hypothetical protein
MIIDGIEIPEWMARNNSREKLEKIIRTKYEPVEEPELEEGDYGIIVITPKGEPRVIAFGLSEESAVQVAQYSDLPPSINFHIFQSTPLTFD